MIRLILLLFVFTSFINTSKSCFSRCKNCLKTTMDVIEMVDEVRQENEAPTPFQSVNISIENNPSIANTPRTSMTLNSPAIEIEMIHLGENMQNQYLRRTQSVTTTTTIEETILVSPSNINFEQETLSSKKSPYLKTTTLIKDY